ncbi:MAG: peptidylprolyl isomerase, partial [Candidatus Diapherotrites archaeon]|nr:peptidylprolyl isomerase [Candidatus Diapherotrites archaeon]
MTLQKKDFIEINFTGKTQEGNIFDSNIEEDLKKANIELKNSPKPFTFALGEGMFLKSVDEFLIGKPETPAKYSLELTPEKAFGIREPKLVQVVPMKVFFEQKINPIPGASLNFDGRMGKILSVSSGRVTVDFNHPLAGKTVIYDINVLRKVEDMNEKISAFN